MALEGEKTMPLTITLRLAHFCRAQAKQDLLNFLLALWLR